MCKSLLFTQLAILLWDFHCPRSGARNDALQLTGEEVEPARVPASPTHALVAHMSCLVVGNVWGRWVQELARLVCLCHPAVQYRCGVDHVIGYNVCFVFSGFIHVSNSAAHYIGVVLCTMSYPLLTLPVLWCTISNSIPSSLRLIGEWGGRTKVDFHCVSCKQ